MPGPRLALAALAVIGVLALDACTAAPSAAARRTTRIRIATGLPGMTFKPLGDALVTAYRGVLPDTEWEVVETAGSVSNLDHLESGTAELGLALADVVYMGFNGHIAELPNTTRNIRGIAVLHPSVVHVLVAKGSRIRSLADLRGRRLGIGPSGSGTAVSSTMLLRAFGVPLDDVQQRPLAFAAEIDALMRGELDAVFITAADPVPIVRQAMQAGARLIDVNGDIVVKLREHYPFLRPATIPADTYPGQPEAIETVLVDVLLVCRATLDDVLVHRLTSALFEVLPQVSATRDYLGLMDVRRAPATPIPLHPGAAWYYREQELSR